MNEERRPSRRRWAEWPSALLLIVAGALVAWKGADYPIGRMRSMGPGFFPVALGVLLMGLGALLLVPGLGGSPGGDDEKTMPVDLRGWGCVVGGILAFIVLGTWGGLVPATFALVFVAALGDRRNSLRTVALTATAMTVIAVVMFSMLLSVQFPLFTWGS